MTKRNYFAIVIYEMPSVLKAFIRIEEIYAETDGRHGFGGGEDG